jgi:hypothetical protein
MPLGVPQLRASSSAASASSPAAAPPRATSASAASARQFGARAAQGPALVAAAELERRCRRILEAPARELEHGARMEHRVERHPLGQLPREAVPGEQRLRVVRSPALAQHHRQGSDAAGRGRRRADGAPVAEPGAQVGLGRLERADVELDAAACDQPRVITLRPWSGR